MFVFNSNNANNNSSNSNSNTIISSSNSNTINGLNSNRLKKYQVLHELVSQNLTNNLDDFRVANIASLNLNFTDNDYKLLGLRLANSENYNEINLNNFNYQNTTFNKYRESYHKVLDGLHLAVINNKLLIQTQKDLSNVNNILNNPTKLANYYNNRYLANKYSTFSEANTSINNLHLQIEYQIYIERYGVPENFIFESEKLSQIRLELS